MSHGPARTSTNCLGTMTWVNTPSRHRTSSRWSWFWPYVWLSCVVLGGVSLLFWYRRPEDVCGRPRHQVHLDDQKPGIILLVPQLYAWQILRQAQWMAAIGGTILWRVCVGARAHVWAHVEQVVGWPASQPPRRSSSTGEELGYLVSFPSTVRSGIWLRSHQLANRNVCSEARTQSKLSSHPRDCLSWISGRALDSKRFANTLTVLFRTKNIHDQMPLPSSTSPQNTYLLRPSGKRR